jgi:ribose/xylose/arabinose/galactoside ABC-type transport system permease subunit/ABC-type branched-subunit amino acid transport system ATPase component
VITLNEPRTTSHEPETRRRTARWLASEHLVLVLTAAAFLVLWPITPTLATRENLANVLLTLLPLLVLACGQTVVLITGGIDLSACAIMAVASVVGGLAMNGDTGWLAGSPWATPVGVLLMLGVGLAIGAFNGFAVATLRMPPFMVTLTGMMFFGGLAIWLTRSETIYNLPSAFNALGGRLPLAAATAGGLALAAHLLLSRTMYGRWLYALGHNPRMARVSGVPVGAATAGAYVLSGLLAAAAAVLYTGQAETASPFLGQRLSESAQLLVLHAHHGQGRGSSGGRAAGCHAPTLAGGRDMSTLLQFEGITKRFGGVPVLRDITLALPAGVTLGLVGENGAGKSTLMNILGGNLRPDAGQMTWDGRSYAPAGPADAAAAGIAFVHQELNLFPNLSIAENLFLTRFPRCGRWPLIHRRALATETTRWLREVGLDASPDTLVERLSAGERQLVEIARALSSQPRLILFDEPTILQPAGASARPRADDDLHLAHA